MKILIISTFFPPQNVIASHRPYSWAKCWSELGHEVHVLTTPKEEVYEKEVKFTVHEVAPYPLYDSLKKFYRRFIKKEASTSFQLKPNRRGRANLFKSIFSSIMNFLVDRGLSSSTRMPDPLDLWISPASAWCDKQNTKWDLVISTFGPYATHMVAHKLKKKKMTKLWVADFRDLWTDSHIFKGIPPFTFIEKILEHVLLKRADLITIVSEPLAQILKTKFPNNLIEVIENGFDTDSLQDISNENIFPDDNKVRLVYTGTIYRNKRDPSPLFQAIQTLKNDANFNSKLLDKLEIIFVGPNVDKVQELVEHYHVQEFVTLKGLIPRSESLRMQRDANILLFLEYEDPSINGILTGKLFEYLSSNTPIWGIGTTDKSTPGQLIIESKTGKLFGKEHKLIKKELIGILQDKNYTNYTPRHDIINQYDRKALANKLLDMIKKL